MSQTLPALTACVLKGQAPVTAKNSPLCTVPGFLAHLHTSWLEPVFRKVPAPLNQFVGSVVPQAKELKISPRGVEQPVRALFQQWLFDQTWGENVTPYSLLAPTALDCLLTMTKERLVLLLDLLGIQDVAIDMRRVLDRESVEKLKALLSETQRQYLEMCGKDNIIPLQIERTPSFWLNHSNPRLLIHSAGLWRLTRLVAGEDPSWVWYLTRRLDMGRGQQIEKWIAQDPKIALQGRPKQVLQEQVVKLVVVLSQ